MDELIAVAREARSPAEIYHLKAAGKTNWPKLEEVIAALALGLDLRSRWLEL